jgi:hypothetical protein
MKSSRASMMSVQPPPAPAQLQQQQILAGIANRLAQLAKDPPDLLAYFRAHAECVAGAFRPVGFVYELLNGSVFQTLLHGNLESLDYKNSPEQEDAFQRAREMAASQRKPVVLPPQSRQTSGRQALSATDSPAPDEMPIFNRTNFEQIFIPFPSGEKTAGILHIWFTPSPASQARVALLRQLCNEIEPYLKAHRAQNAFQEVTRLTTYARLLEELTGDIDLDSISWKLVNYAREAVACERVCLFIADNYDHPTGAHLNEGALQYRFRLQACSGLKKPHPKSEQAVILQEVARKLTEMSLTKAPDATAPAVASAPPPPAPTGSANGEREIVAEPSRAAGSSGQSRTRLTLMMRDPSKTASRPPEVNEYFEVMPMNWATVIPLFDREDRVCGILLFEGVKLDEKLAGMLKPMMELAASAGKSLGTTLYLTQHRSVHFARRLVAMHQEYVDTPAKRKWMRFGLPVLLVAGVLALPIPYTIKGNASVLPVNQSALPALVSTRLLEVDVHEGQEVKQGQILARFETTDLQLQLSQAEQEYQRALVESDAALNLGNEAQMEIARLNADKAAAAAEKLQIDISRAVLRAPFDGLVLGAQDLSTRVGEILRMGEPALRVVDPTAWQVKATLKERNLINLDQRLHAVGPVPATLRLAANPANKYHLTLTASRQLAYGLDTTTGEYLFTAMLPLNVRLDQRDFLKAGFTGQLTFDAGIRPLAYVLFKDFFEFLTIRFF